MKDTPLKFSQMVDEKYRRLSPTERIEMATSMFECAKEIVISSIVSANPSVSASELKKQVFLRFYGSDYADLEKRNRILESF